MNPDQPLIARLRSVIAETLRPLVPGHGPVALLDFPAYSNVGDSAIWLGTRRVLEALGVRRLAYTCDTETYDAARLRRAVGGGVILLQGGGNIGDLWERHQHFREVVLRDFPENRVVQLPQSIHFRERNALTHAREAFDAHRDFTLLVREEQSLAIARREFRCRIEMCPDPAFWLDPPARERPRPAAVTWLLRTDVESTGRADGPPAAGSTDWLEERRTPLLALDRRLRRFHARAQPGRTICAGLLRSLQSLVARQRLDRGYKVVAGSDTLVTDRLHGHILSVLLGVPHVLLDNSYGKVGSFHRTWTSGSRLTRWAESIPAARALLAPT